LVNLYFTEPMNRVIRTSGPTSRRWFRWLGPALVASILLLVPNVIVARDLQYPRRLESVSVGVRRDKLGAAFVPLIV
jgi:hypothetical protein